MSAMGGRMPPLSIYSERMACQLRRLLLSNRFQRRKPYMVPNQKVTFNPNRATKGFKLLVGYR